MTPIIAFLTIALIVLPQWILMIAKPHSKWTQQLVDSDIIPFLLLVIYVMTIARNGDNFHFHSLSDIFNVFQLDNIVLGAWAFVGFISLLIGGWAFNRVNELTVEVKWIVMPSLFSVFMIISVAIMSFPLG